MAGAGFAVSRELLDWLEGLASNGAFVVTADGTGGFSPPVDKLVRAVHTVLAGGEVEVVVKTPGDPGRRQELDASLDAALGAASVSNRTLGSFIP